MSTKPKFLIVTLFVKNQETGEDMYNARYIIDGQVRDMLCVARDTLLGAKQDVLRMGIHFGYGWKTTKDIEYTSVLEDNIPGLSIK